MFLYFFTLHFYMLVGVALFIIQYSNTMAQSKAVDSLKNLLQTEIADTTRITTLNTLAWELKSINSDTAITLSQQALAIVNTLSANWRKGRGRAATAQSHHNLGWFNYLKGNYELALRHYHKALEIWKLLEKDLTAESASRRSRQVSTMGNIGLVYSDQGNYPKALECFFKVLKIFEEFGDKNKIATALGNIGIVYYFQGDYPKALKYYFQALKMDKELGDKESFAVDLGNIGSIYKDQGNYPKALEYYYKALEIAEELGNKSHIASWLGNIGIVYYEQSDYPKALGYYYKALKMVEELGDKGDIAIWLNNIGIVYKKQGDLSLQQGDTAQTSRDYSKALEYYFKALELRKELGAKNLISSCLGNIGSLYSTMKNYREAEPCLLQALEISLEINALSLIKNHHERLSKLYQHTGQYQKAYEHHREYSIAKDSLFNEEKSKELGKLEARYEFEMAEMKRKAEEEQQQQLTAAVKKRSNLLQYSGILIFIVLLFIGVSMLGRLTLSVRWAEGIVFFTFLLFFEFTLVLLDPYIERFSAGAPAIKLAFNAVLAGLIFPLHSFFEGQLKKRIIK
ncbi:MAG: tetratricopeptide repeat protein [Bacteroidota bacterium]